MQRYDDDQIDYRALQAVADNVELSPWAEAYPYDAFIELIHIRRAIHLIHRPDGLREAANEKELQHGLSILRMAEAEARGVPFQELCEERGWKYRHTLDFDTYQSPPPPSRV